MDVVVIWSKSCKKLDDAPRRNSVVDAVQLVSSGSLEEEADAGTLLLPLYADSAAKLIRERRGGRQRGSGRTDGRTDGRTPTILWKRQKVRERRERESAASLTLSSPSVRAFFRTAVRAFVRR